MKWALGMTIAPRSPATYIKTLDSLAETGWEEVTLFIEPGVTDIPQPCNVVLRSETLGGWKNFYYGLSELVEKYPKVDCYGMIQDDVVFCKGIRSYLEKTLWPSKDCGMVSVYNPECYGKNKPRGWFEINVGNALWGNLAVFFKPSVAKKFVLKNIHSSDYHIDNTIGQFLKDNKTPPYYHTPSLAQHIGHDTTIWAKSNTVSGSRMASDFVGEDYNVALNG